MESEFFYRNICQIFVGLMFNFMVLPQPNYQISPPHAHLFSTPQ